MMDIENIAITKELKPGFIRSSVVIGKTMILLFKVKKDVLLEKHKHIHAQFGYCFSGEFIFNVGNQINHVKKGMSYTIAPNIFHSAIAKTDYYSLDFKNISSDNLTEIQYNVMSSIKENMYFNIDYINLGKDKIYHVQTKIPLNKIPLNLSKNKRYYLISGNTIKTNILIEPMKIYQIDSKMACGIHLNKHSNIFIIEI